MTEWFLWHIPSVCCWVLFTIHEDFLFSSYIVRATSGWDSMVSYVMHWCSRVCHEDGWPGHFVFWNTAGPIYSVLIISRATAEGICRYSQQTIAATVSYCMYTCIVLKLIQLNLQIFKIEVNVGWMLSMPILSFSSTYQRMVRTTQFSCCSTKLLQLHFSKTLVPAGQSWTQVSWLHYTIMESYSSVNTTCILLVCNIEESNSACLTVANH